MDGLLSVYDKTKLKICFLSREYPPSSAVGGIATYTSTAARLLASAGHEIHVITYGTESGMEDGVRVHRLSMLPHHFKDHHWFYAYRRWYRNKLPLYLDAMTWARTVAEAFPRLHKRHQFQVLEYPETMGEGSLLSNPPGFLKICRIHSSSFEHLGHNFLEKKLLRKFQLKGCLAAHRVVSPSRHGAEFYAPFLLKLKTPVQVRRNPFEPWTEPLRWSEKKPDHVLFVGRLEFRKGLQFLLRAMEGMKFPKPITVRVIGSAEANISEEDFQLRREFAQRLGLTSETDLHRGPFPHTFKEQCSNIHWQYFPQLPRLDLRMHFDWAGIFVFPSLSENYPYVLLEALSRGCFPLIADSGGSTEILEPPLRGKIFPRGNWMALQSSLLECLGRGVDLEKDFRVNAEAMKKNHNRENQILTLLESYGR